MMYLKFLWSLLRHKYFVFIECCRLGIPWLGVIHDWSKFLPSEFIPYARYFYGNYPARADIHGDMRNILPDRYTAEGVHAAFDVAWLHHQKRNRHHWQYWLLQYDQGEKPVALPMPDHYRLEMLADWSGAGRAYGNPDTARWYNENRECIILHPETRKWVELELLKQTHPTVPLNMMVRRTRPERSIL